MRVSVKDLQAGEKYYLLSPDGETVYNKHTLPNGDTIIDLPWTIHHIVECAYHYKVYYYQGEGTLYSKNPRLHYSVEKDMYIHVPNNEKETKTCSQ